MTKPDMRAICAEVNIAVPDGVTKKQLNALLDDYFETAAAVIISDYEIGFLQTDKPTEEYIVKFMICGEQRIRAESELAARQWVGSNLLDYDHPFEYMHADITYGQITDCYKEEES